MCRVMCTSSGWFKHIEPFRTFSNHIIGELARCVKFVDMNQSTRYQTTTVMNRDQYHFSEVCPKLKPFSVTGGHYQMVCIEPRIFFFVFERRDITAASKALRSFVRKERQVV